MTIFLNGESRDNSVATVGELVATLPLPPQAILVEQNGLALRRDEWPERKLGEGDRIEIVRIVAGG